MNQDIERIAETFAAHEYLAPDAVEVLKNAKGRARAYHRRRVATRATGGAVLGAGLVAGGITIPGLTPHSTSGGSATIATGAGSLPASSSAASSAAASSAAASSAAPSSAVTASPAPTPSYTDAEELAAYFAAGYDYNNAVQLSQLWNDGTDIATVKATAGLKLLEGQPLPVQPNGTPESPADADRSAFFAAGYGYDDAVTLGKLWNETDTFQVKADAGQLLLAGKTLPIQPSSNTDAAASPDPANAGGTMSIGPSGAPESQADKARDAFFAAGYTYDDAVTLGKMWNETDTYQVKADAGQKLLDGLTLPIKP